MSSILDALNKSEAERRSAPPGLNTPLHFASRPPPRRRKPWLLPLIAVAALGLAWAGGLFDSGGSSDEQSSTATSESGNPESASLSPIGDTGDAAPTTDPVPVANGSTADATANEPTQGFGSGQQQRSALAPKGPMPAPFRPRHPGAPLPSAQPAPPPPAATPSPEPEAIPPQAAAAPTPSPAAPTASASTTPAPSGSGVPTLNELPFATRRTLPSLNLTMHLYSADPDRRLVLINGVQARDGDELEGGIQIRSIRPDGVVIVFENTEFLLPARN